MKSLKTVAIFTEKSWEGKRVFVYKFSLTPGHWGVIGSPRYGLLTWGNGSLFSIGRNELKVSFPYSGMGWNRGAIKAVF